MLRELAEKENIGRDNVTLDDLAERDVAKNDFAFSYSCLYDCPLPPFRCDYQIY